MKRNGGKSVARKRSTSVKPEHRTKPGGSTVSAKDRGRSSRGSRTLQKLFEIGTETFKRLDTDTIMRVAEDKDLEYL
jgi:hypothetical protein